MALFRAQLPPAVAAAVRKHSALLIESLQRGRPWLASADRLAPAVVTALGDVSSALLEGGLGAAWEEARPLGVGTGIYIERGRDRDR